LYDEELRYFVLFNRHHYWDQVKADGAGAVRSSNCRDTKRTQYTNLM